MRKYPLIFLFTSFFVISLFLIGCDAKEDSSEEFQFTDDIKKFILTGKGVKNNFGTRTFDKEYEINIIKNAMQNANVSSNAHTDEGPLYEIEVIYENNLNKIIQLWYSPSKETGRFYTDKTNYSINIQAVPELIELLESIN